jgi:ribosome-associated toxin RatA of RatAB toxin-antitoxin module
MDAMIKLVLALLALSIGAASAAAQSGPTLKLGRDEARDAMTVDAAIEIAAPPATVWAVVADCARAAKYVPNMESCRVVKREAKGADIRETVMNYPMIPRIRTLTRMDLEPNKRMAFKLIEGDMRVAEGGWRLEPRDNGKATQLRYHSVFALGFFVPQFMLRQTAEADVPAMMKAIERESLKDAGKR